MDSKEALRQATIRLIQMKEEAGEMEMSGEHKARGRRKRGGYYFFEPAVSTPKRLTHTQIPQGRKNQ